MSSSTQPRVLRLPCPAPRRPADGSSGGDVVVSIASPTVVPTPAPWRAGSPCTRPRARAFRVVTWLCVVGLGSGCSEPPSFDGGADDPFATTTDDGGRPSDGGFGDAGWPPAEDGGGGDGGGGDGSSTTTSGAGGGGTSDGGSGDGENDGADAGGGADADGGVDADGDGDGDGDGGDPAQLAAAQAGIRLVEILPDPAGKDGVDAPEFVELVFHGVGPIPVSGLRLEARSWPTVDLAERLEPLTALAAGTRVVLERWTSAAAPRPDLDPSDGVVHAIFASTSGLRNGDGGVILRAADDRVLDGVSYGAAQDPPFPAAPAVGAPPAGETLCRAEGAAGGASAGPDDLGPWALCAPSPGAPHGSPTPSNSGLVLVEYHPHFGALDPIGENNEFIEFVVTSSDPLELNLQLRVGEVVRPLDALWASDCGGKDCALPGQRVLVVGDQYVGDFDVAPILFVPSLYLGGSAPLGPTPVVRIERTDGTVLSTLGSWGDPAAWPARPAGDVSLHRVLVSEPDVPSAWAWSAPSPHAP